MGREGISEKEKGHFGSEVGVGKTQCSVGIEGRSCAEAKEAE